MTQENRTPALPTAILLAKEPIVIDPAALAEELRRRYPVLQSVVPLPAGDKARPNSTIIGVDGSIVAALAVNAPVPDGWRELAQRSIQWPGAVEICAQHHAHVVVAFMGQPKSLLAAARVITAVAGAIAALNPVTVVAGLWGARVLNSVEVWVSLSAGAFTPYPNLPTSLWVSQHLFQDEVTDGVGVLTQGLTRFVGRELELIAPKSDLRGLLDHAFCLTTYLLQNGPVLKEGSTFGVSESDRIEVHLQNSTRFDNLPVIAATLGASQLATTK